MSELEKVGRFDVLERIGVGSFSVVYRGEDSSNQQPVAIKICIAQDENLRTGFLRLAEIAGRLRHPNIVSVLEFGSGDGKPYLVEEYVPSEHLGWRIEGDQPIPFETRMEFLHQIADGLHYAHGQGVIHKHVAPRSIRILNENQAKITDFGIAQLSNATARLTDPDGSSRTDGYIAPEQALGLRADGRTDIFCFGALAYELLTYRKPFSANSLPELFEQVLKGAGPADEDFSGISPAMEGLIRRCLRRDPMERYSTVKDLMGALREAEKDSSASNGNKGGQAAAYAPEDTQAIPEEAVAHARTPTEAEDPGDQTIFAGTVLPELPQEPQLSQEPEASQESGPPQEEAPEQADKQPLLAEAPPPLPKGASSKPGEPKGSAAGSKAKKSEAATPKAVTPPEKQAEKDSKETAAPKVSKKTASKEEGSKAQGPKEERKGLSGTTWAWIAAGVALLVVAFLASRFLKPEAPPAPPPVVAETPRVQEPAPLAPAVLQGFLVIDARPWAQVQRLLRPDGSEVGTPGDFTPLHLSLEQGTYFVELIHPDVEEPQVCEVEVVANTSARCWVEFKATSPTDYFKRAGWWR